MAQTADTWNATSAEDASNSPEVCPKRVSQTQASSVTASATFQSFSISSSDSIPVHISTTRAASSTPAVSQSPFSSLHFNRNKVHAEKIVLIVVSVIGAAMLITVIFVCFRRRHTGRRAKELPSVDNLNEAYMAEAGDLLIDSGPPMPIQYYDPSDPNTFPQPIMLPPIPAAQTTQSGENGNGTKSAGTNDRTNYSGLPLV